MTEQREGGLSLCKGDSLISVQSLLDRLPSKHDVHPSKFSNFPQEIQKFHAIEPILHYRSCVHVHTQTSWWIFYNPPATYGSSNCFTISIMGWDLCWVRLGSTTCTPSSCWLSACRQIGIECIIWFDVNLMTWFMAQLLGYRAVL